MGRYCEPGLGMIQSIEIHCQGPCEYGVLEGVDVPPSRYDAKLFAEHLGWRFIDGKGWLCPECEKEAE